VIVVGWSAVMAGGGFVTGAVLVRFLLRNDYFDGYEDGQKDPVKPKPQRRDAA
jgi:hypothetical protein